MTNVQKLQIRQSEIRERLNALSAPEADSTEESKAEIDRLMVEIGEIEPKLRAAIVAEQETVEARNDERGSGDTRLDDLRKRASVSEYIRQAIHGQPLDGACRELNEELKITAIRGQGGGVLMPIEQLALQHRADVANTTTSAEDADETSRRPIFGRLFARGVMDAMGIRLDAVPAGLIEYPILTAGPAPAQTAEGTDAADTIASTWESQILKPKRLIAQYEYTAESIAAIPGLDSALSADLQMSFTSQMDKEILTGDGTGANVRGLDTAIDFKVANIPDPTGVVNFSDAIGYGLEAIDGLHASSEADISLLIGPASYRKIAAILQTNTVSNAFDVLRSRGTTIVTSAHVAPPASNIQRGYVHAGRDMARGDSVASLWNAMELIRDPYTKAGESKTIITAVALWDAFCGFRPNSYKGIKAKLA